MLHNPADRIRPAARDLEPLLYMTAYVHFNIWQEFVFIIEANCVLCEVKKLRPT